MTVRGKRIWVSKEQSRKVGVEWLRNIDFLQAAIYQSPGVNSLSNFKPSFLGWISEDLWLSDHRACPCKQPTFFFSYRLPLKKKLIKDAASYGVCGTVVWGIPCDHLTLLSHRHIQPWTIFVVAVLLIAFIWVFIHVNTELGFLSNLWASSNNSIFSDILYFTFSSNFHIKRIATI